MTDRELLELAAKAAGLNFVWDDGGEWGFIPHAVAPHNRRASDKLNGTIWSPLTDDGDALRLAVKLGLAICFLGGTTYINKPGRNPQDEQADHNGDPCAATRRAIVRAAAAVGGAA